MVSEDDGEQFLADEYDDDHVRTMFPRYVRILFDELLIQIVETPVYRLRKRIVEVMGGIDLVYLSVLSQSLYQIFLYELSTVFIVAYPVFMTMLTPARWRTLRCSERLKCL